MSDLPKGWSIAPLCELTKPTRPRSLPTAFPELPYIGMEQIEAHTRQLIGILPSTTMKSISFRFFKGDVLYGRLRPYLNKVYCAEFDGLCSSEFIVLPPSSAFEPKYLTFFLNTESFVAYTNLLNKGDRPRVSFDQISTYLIPIPPLNEQRRIVEKVEKLLGKVNACRKRLDKIPHILKRFRQSILAAACSGRLTADWRAKFSPIENTEWVIKRIQQQRINKYESDCMKAISAGLKKPRRPTNLEPEIRFSDTGETVPESWFWASFEDIASTDAYSMSSGPFGSALGRKDYTGSGIPVIRGQNIQSGKFVLSKFVFVSHEKASELRRSTVYPKDIIVVAVGSSGQAAMVPQELPLAILSQNCNKITVDNNFALPDYVNLFLQVQISKDHLREKTTDTARPFLSLTNLKTLLLPIPPIEEQQEIVRRVEDLFKLADQIEARYNKAKTYIDKLTQSILAKAFRGELVPQDPNDEPASLLLERIRRERVKAEPTNKKARPLSKKKQASLFDEA